MLRKVVRDGCRLCIKHTCYMEPCVSLAVTASSAVTGGREMSRSPLLLSQRCLLGRSCASFTDKEATKEEQDLDVKRLEGAQLMRSLNAYAFREHLNELSERKMHISFNELTDLALQRGAAATKHESRALCEALVSSGVIFRFRDMVFLSTDDIAEIILSSLPDTEAEFEERVKKIEAELRPLERQKQMIEEAASKSSSRILWLGLFILIFQFAGFLRLTFWELSWDWIEPVAYFVSLGNGIVIYTYFLYNNENFEYDTVRNRLKKFFQKENESKFDVDKYEKLAKEAARYRKYLVRYRP